MCLLQQLITYTILNKFTEKTCQWQTRGRLFGIVNRETGSPEPFDAGEDDHEPVAPPISHLPRHEDLGYETPSWPWMCLSCGRFYGGEW
jgi:hypothetical protein